MITALEEAVLNEITTRIAALKTGGVQKDAKQLLTANAVAVAVLEGTFKEVAQREWRQDVTVSVLVKFKNMTNEEARRKGINPIVAAVIQLLVLKTFGLKIQPLVPKRFRDVTTEEKYAAGVIEYLIEFGTSFTIKALDEEAVTDLITVGLSYLLKPGDSIADASDTIHLEV
ncbi:hypothetical protein GMLC_14620 [Geomonas limicola]|uniref:Uncharacterized protein n=1 Tax=Geomonas limicola TaxID=2740186 RepID=A0A6V8N8P4_9BACT|nr:phage protein Gp37 [Geomonas limicola]GFO67883.1 hypothetical protein GMLC_14620 [Geomonas limicola]